MSSKVCNETELLVVIRLNQKKWILVEPQTKESTVEQNLKISGYGCAVTGRPVRFANANVDHGNSLNADLQYQNKNELAKSLLQFKFEKSLKVKPSFFYQCETRVDNGTLQIKIGLHKMQELTVENYPSNAVCMKAF